MSFVPAEPRFDQKEAALMQTHLTMIENLLRDTTKKLRAMGTPAANEVATEVIICRQLARTGIGYTTLTDLDLKAEAES